MPNNQTNKNSTLILKISKKLFWKYGLRKVSVEEICKEAGISKMTFYRNFKNKNEVAKLIMEELATISKQEFDDILNQDINFPNKISKLLEIKKEYSKKISYELVKDIYHPSCSELKAILEQNRSKQLKALRTFFRQGQKDGWVNKKLSIDFILYMMEDIGKKIEDEKLIAMYKNPSKLILHLTEIFFYGIAENNQKK